jgi:hypothetical protein
MMNSRYRIVSCSRTNHFELDIVVLGFELCLVAGPQSHYSFPDMNQKERDDLDAAYLDTNYVVSESDSRIVIKIGENNPALEQLLVQECVAEWAFITAYNPYSQQLAATENADRQQKMYSLLERRNLLFLNGFGEAANGEWPPEPSLLVLGLKRELAVELAKEFKQNAIVCGQKGKEAELVWCR